LALESITGFTAQTRLFLVRFQKNSTEKELNFSQKLNIFAKTQALNKPKTEIFALF